MLTITNGRITIRRKKAPTALRLKRHLDHIGSMRNRKLSNSPIGHQKGNLVMTAAKNVTEESTIVIIGKKIESIRKRGAQLREDCHECLVMIIEHAMGKGNGDISKLPDLLSAVGDTLGSSQKQAANQWLFEFVPFLEWVEEKGKAARWAIKKGAERVIKGAENKATNMIGPDDKKIVKTCTGQEFKFFWLERSVDPKPFDAIKAFRALLANMERAYEANVEKGAHNNINRAQIDLLKSIHLDQVKDEPSDTAPVTADDTDYDQANYDAGHGGNERSDDAGHKDEAPVAQAA